jgi:uncharacterized protein
MTNSEVTDEKLQKYFKLTDTALKLAKIKKTITKKEQKTCEEFIDFCQRYLSDAKHFAEKGDKVTAFAAVNYAHAWLDSAAIAGWLDIKHKDRNKYFTID